MKRIIAILALVAMANIGQTQNIQTGRPVEQGKQIIIQKNDLLDKVFKSYSVFKLNAGNLKQLVTSQMSRSASTQAAPVTISLELGSLYKWDLELEPNEIRAANYRAIELGPDGIETLLPREAVNTYKGVVKSHGGGMVRISIDKDFIYGLVMENGEAVYIEALSNIVKGASKEEYLVYKESDVRPDATEKCAALEVQGRIPPKQSATQAQSMVCKEVQFATAADFSMFQAYGNASAVNNQIIAITNLVDGIYESHFEVSYNIVTQLVISCDNCEPAAWNHNSGFDNTSGEDTVNIYQLLVGFSNWGSGGGFGTTHDLGQLWTNLGCVYYSNPPFGGTRSYNTIGLAWIGGTCNNFKYSVCEDVGNLQLNKTLSAHEIGHNFNSSHDAGGATTIMAPSIPAGGSSIFSANSISVINNYIGTINCLGACTAGPTCTYSIDPTFTSSISSAGATATFELTADPTCAWTATRNCSFVTITNSSGTGPATVSFAVAANTGLARTCTITIGSVSHVISQNAAPCTPAAAGAITGPVTVCEGQANQRYSINPVSGATTYTWTVPAGATIAAGQNTAAITVSFANTAGDVSVTPSNSCGNGTGSSKAVAISGAIPGAPDPIVAPTMICTNAKNVNISVPAIAAATTYTWTVPSGSTILSGQGTATIVVNFGAINGAITVKGLNSCGTGPTRTLNIVLNSAPPTPGTISGPSAICANQSNATYTVADVPRATTYTWTVPAGSMIHSGQGTPTIVVNFGAISGNLTLVAKNDCGSSPTLTKTLTMTQFPQAAGSISGPANVCAGQTGQRYSINTVTGATSYIWSVPAGASITSGQNTTGIYVSFGNNSGDVSVTPVNTCGNGTGFSKAVTVVMSAPAAPDPISMPVVICTYANNVSISIPPIAGASTYTWTLPSGSTFISGQGTPDIVVKFGLTSGAITVRGSNACGNGPLQSRNVVLNSAPPTPGAIGGLTSACLNTSGVGFAITPVIRATSYQWIVPATATITSGQGTSAIFVDFATTGGYVYVKALNDCGSSANASKFISITNIPTGTATLSGPATICSGKTANYSVTGVTGASTYTWSVPVDATILSGQNTPNVTVSFATMSGHVSVSSTNNCGNGPSAMKVVTVNPRPDAPLAISGPALVCQSSTYVKYTIDPVAGATSYTWKTPVGHTIVNGATTPTASINFGSTAANSVVSVTANNACGFSPTTTFAVAVNGILPPTPGAINGPTSICANQSNVIFTLNTTPAPTYTWTVPANAVITAGQGTGTITVDFGPNAGTVSVRAQNDCGVSAAAQKIVGLTNLPGSVTSVSGLTSVCSGQAGLQYSAFGATGATTYIWSVPTNAVITNRQGASITVSFATVSGDVSVTPANVCGNGGGVAKSVMVKPKPDAPVSIIGPGAVCQNSYTPYNVAPVSGATNYTWTAPPGAFFSGFSTSPNVTLYYPGTTSGNLRVVANNSCGSSPAAILFIQLDPAPKAPTSITGSFTVPANQTNVSYTANAIPGATGYTWTVPAGATITSGQGTSSIMVDFGSTGGQITVFAMFVCGNSTTYSRTVSVSGQRGGISKNAGSLNYQLSIFPNPANENCSLKIVCGEENIGDQCSLELVSMLGVLVRKYDLNINAMESIVDIDLHGLAKGTYMLKMSKGGDSQLVKLIVM